MKKTQKHCRYLIRVNYVAGEIGDGGMPTVIPDQWKCKIDQAYYGMEWSKCEQTPFEGPCWQFSGQFASTEEWENWAKQQLKK